MKLFKNTQSGRSMVEMLGVLAIIGVLSIGGIAGYSKAMLKYKINQTMDILSHGITRVVEMYVNGNGEGVGGASSMKATGIMPDCKVKNGNHCEIPLGFTIFSINKTDSNVLYGNIDLYFEVSPRESCIAFLSSGILSTVPNEWWNNGGYIAVKPSSASGSNASAILYPDETSKLSNTDISNACGACISEYYCFVKWHFGPSE